jgi:2-keto-4-pentenoate hydratase/2-oxohepta-3-ene-1,7-dioic acid hydratase in catechol pathway
LLQDGNTADFLFSVAQVLVIMSEVMTLEPGDVIITGTPAGVGYARKPPIFMKAGDICEVEVEGVGILLNTIANEVS